MADAVASVGERGGQCQTDDDAVLCRDVCRQTADPARPSDRSVVDHRAPTRGQQGRELRSQAVEDACEVELELAIQPVPRRLAVERDTG